MTHQTAESMTATTTGTLALPKNPTAAPPTLASQTPPTQAPAEPANPTSSSETPAESRLDAALAEYMERSDLGETVHRAEFLDKYQDIRVELAAFFRMADQLADAQLGKLLEGRKPPSLSESLASVAPLALPAAGDEAAPLPVARPVPAKPVPSPPADKAPEKTDKAAPNEAVSRDAAGKDGAGKDAKPKSRPKRPRDRVERARERRGWRLWIHDRFRETPGAAISAALHALVLLLLGLMTLPLPAFDQLDIPILVQQNEDDLPAIEPIVQVVQQEAEAESTEAVQTINQLSDSVEISSLNDAPATALRTDLSDLSAQHTMSMDSLVASSSKTGDGLGKGGMGKVKFFGQATSGQKFVFVIDNSGSMKQGRFETALYELQLAVEQMQPRQSFYVLFFSDTAYPLFHPEPAPTFVPATTANKQKLAVWLKTVEMCLRTNAMEAMQKAISMQPDVIYLLGDGAFTDKTDSFLASLPSGPQIHVMGMEVAAKNAISFKAIADKFKGTYKDVGVHPDAREYAKLHGKDYLRKRGPVWGLKLPE